MTAQKGRDLLLRIEDQGSYVTVAGLRARSISLNAEAVDVTNQDSAGQWRELLSGAGVKSARLSGAGIFTDSASDSLVREKIFDGVIPQFEVVIPDFGTITGAFHITSFELTGLHDGEVSFDLALESAGALSFAVL